MQQFKYLIIGGGIAGTTAAETLRKAKPDASIAIVSDEAHPFYSRVLLSKPSFILGEQPFDSVWLKSESWYADNRISFLGGKSAVSLDPSKKLVRLSDGFELNYEQLLLATGAHARKWNVPGSDKAGVHYLRTVDHAKAIMDEIKAGKKHAVMIGSSCVTFEIAEILRSQNIEVTEVMREHYFWEPALSETEGVMIEKKLDEKGVKIYRDTEVAEVIGNGKVEGVVLKDGTRFECDMILCFIGVVFDLGWLSSSGIATTHGIVANEYMETSLPDVWAAGDVAEFNDIILKETLIAGNWMSGRAQGETAAKNMAGAHVPFRLVSFHTSHGFGNMIGFTGDVRPHHDCTFIFRGTPESGAITRLLVRNGRVVGATMINKMNEMSPAVKLTESNMDVSGIMDKLADPDFDLKSLIAPVSAPAPSQPIA